MGFGAALSSLLTTGTQAAGAYKGAQNDARKATTADLMQTLQLLRQKRQDEDTQALHAAQIRNYDETPIIKSPRKVVQDEHGNYVSVNEETGEATPVTMDGGPEMQDSPGVPFMAGASTMQEPTGKRIRTPVKGKVEPKNPVVGSPAWKEAERFKASLQPPPASFSFPTVTTPEGQTVVGRANSRTGEVEPTEIGAPRSGRGGSGGRPPTEAQEKSYLFHRLMVQGDDEMTQALASGNVRPAAITAMMRSPGALDAAVNMGLNADEQLYVRGLRSFMAGALRKETGAAFSKSELADTYNRYGDAIGDQPAVGESKRKARRDYIATMEQSAIPAAQYYKSAAPSGGPPAGGKPMSPKAYQAAREAGYSDAEIRAKGYTIPRGGP